MSLTIDIAKAKAFQLMVQNMIGEQPILSVDQDRQQVRVDFTPDQREKMIKWLDSQIFASMEPQQDSELQIGFGQVLFPWAMRYVIPTALIVFFAGYISNGFKKIRR